MGSSSECVDAEEEEEEEVSLLFLGQESQEENEKPSQGPYTANKTVTLSGKQGDYVLAIIVP